MDLMNISWLQLIEAGRFGRPWKGQASVFSVRPLLGVYQQAPA
jgi:hypothetical protein